MLVLDLGGSIKEAGVGEGQRPKRFYEKYGKYTPF
jgi:hypothetical protein